jgi:nucleoid-associated protein YgaU
VVRSQPIVDNPAASIASQDEPSPPTVAAEVTGIREIDEPSAHADVGRVADPTPATTSRERNPVIPAPPGGARVKRPNPAPTTSVEPTGSVLARAKPVTKESPAEPAMVKAEPIAQAKPPEASTGGENAVATPIDEGEEYRPIHRGGERYIPLGSVTAEDRPAEEFYSADYLPLSGSRLARGETTVVSQVRKAGLETPRVVAYDARMYVTLEGDTFDKIADTMYRSPAYGAALARYNRSASGPTDFLSPGSRVRIPPIGILDGSGANGAEASREAFQRVPPPSALAEPAPKVSATNPFDAALIGGSSSAPTGPGEYRTQEVETLWSVAKKTLGDGRRWREIYNLNRDRLTNEINVPVGLVLKIPKTGTP